jgi:ribosomal protein L5
MITEVFPKFKNFKGLNQKISEKVFSYKLTEVFNFPELENHYYLFNNLAILNITIITNSKTKEETMFLLKAFKLPFLLIV